MSSLEKKRFVQFLMPRDLGDQPGLFVFWINGTCYINKDEIVLKPNALERFLRRRIETIKIPWSKVTDVHFKPYGFFRKWTTGMFLNGVEIHTLGRVYHVQCVGAKKLVLAMQALHKKSP